MTAKYGIDNKVWEVVIGKNPITPERITLAASLSPEILEERKTWSCQSSLLKTERSRFAVQSLKTPVMIRKALVEWVADQKQNAGMFGKLLNWDPKLATWCWSHCVQEVVAKRYDYHEEVKALMEATQNWAKGKITSLRLDKAKREFADWDDYNDDDDYDDVIDGLSLTLNCALIKDVAYPLDAARQSLEDLWYHGGGLRSLPLQRTKFNLWVRETFQGAIYNFPYL